MLELSTKFTISTACNPNKADACSNLPSPSVMFSLEFFRF